MLCRRSYIAVQVVLTTNSVVYNLSTLIDAILAAENTGHGGDGTTSPRAVRILNLENDISVVSSIFVGDALLVAGASQPARRGRKILTGASINYNAGDVNGIDVGQLYVTGAVNGAVLNVELMTI
jgi:hypothetical protein